MQKLQDIQEKIFLECSTILETLSGIDSKEELLAKQDLFVEITDRIAFLRILEKNKENFVSEEALQNVVNEELNQYFSNEIIAPATQLADTSFEDNQIEDELMLTNELNDIENDEVLNAEEERPVTVEEPEENCVDTPSMVPQQTDHEERVAQKEREFLELEERRRKIVEFSREDVVHPPKEEAFQETNTEHHHVEKKFKLAHIKGLKVVQNLFDEDPLDKLEAVKPEKPEKVKEEGSILKTNIPTDFMEAEKKKHEFKLDFNDKIAFTKLLFKGNEQELKVTIDKLNSFSKLEDAKQYLSEIYYAKDWQKADEYAQRLWNLVESKFL